MQKVFYGVILTIILFTHITLPSSAIESKQPVDYVNPYIGNISHLLVPTYPTIHLPNSMLRVYPERENYTGNQIGGLPLIVTSHRGSSAFNISLFNSPNQLEAVKLYTYDNKK